MVTGASMNRHRSCQTYSTPADFRTAIVKRFGMPSWDLAASEENHFSPKGKFFDEDNNSLIHDWHKIEGFLWLNPPFGAIEPWAQKCHEESVKGAKILFLVPASVGSFWFQAHVFQKARIFFVAPRLCFDGKSPFPKDVVLAHYGNIANIGFECWRWKP